MTTNLERGLLNYCVHDYHSLLNVCRRFWCGSADLD